MKLVNKVAAIGAVFALSSAVSADVFKAYDGSWAAKYAIKNYRQPYAAGTTTGNPFRNFSILEGGNCTNFVSQALIAGFIKSDVMRTVFDNRYEFDTDFGCANCSLA
ncbi:amidase domain-containing protein [uncultured Thiodictyon sp.]|uniref:amidase domain-containing protein n=1 Tax=uncultured Thiodictyon sp. TaxID=1846217 RepID=UPI0025F2BA80|nr:amidase domain-containing protein [uncultured Thiodictyon sp.]